MREAVFRGGVEYYAGKTITGGGRRILGGHHLEAGSRVQSRLYGVTEPINKRPIFVAVLEVVHPRDSQVYLSCLYGNTDRGSDIVIENQGLHRSMKTPEGLILYDSLTIAGEHFAGYIACSKVAGISSAVFGHRVERTFPVIGPLTVPEY